MVGISHNGILDTSGAQKYCIDAKPTDFYFADEETLCLNSVEIERALSVALRCQQRGPSRAAMLLVCKLADGYRQYDKKRREFKNKEE